MDLSGPGIDVKLKERKRMKERNFPISFLKKKFKLDQFRITYSKGHRGRNEAFHPSVPSSIHGWHHIIILYNVKAEKLLLKNSCSLAICQKLKTNFKKLKIVEKNLEKQEKKSF
jgi:hypothetical protein